MFEDLKEKAKKIRIDIINEIASIGQGHVGGSLSAVEILVYLYYKEMNIDPADPKKKDRDRFVCSKGHAGPLVYACLADKGYFPSDWLLTLNKNGTRLPSHADMTKTPGVDFTAGSLGQGFSAAVGIALAQKTMGIKARTFALVGDGESQEGEIWEAAENAAQFGLDNLTVFVDYNKLQLDGPTSQICSTEGIETRFRGFGFDVIRINGHCFDDISRAVERSKSIKGMPHCIICDTIKAKGFKDAENKVSSHSMAVSAEKAAEVVKSIRESV